MKARKRKAVALRMLAFSRGLLLWAMWDRRPSLEPGAPKRKPSPIRFRVAWETRERGAQYDRRQYRPPYGF